MSRDNTTPSLLCKVVKPLFLYKFIFTTLVATSTLINFTKRHINPVNMIAQSLFEYIMHVYLLAF